MNSGGMFFAVLAGLSTLTSLVVEGVKKLLDEKQVKYSANLLAVIVSVIFTAIVSVLYIVYTATPVTPQIIVSCVGLMIFSFLSSTVGYDKIKQLIEQLAGK